ncbi:MAG: hypothetical protein IPP73_05025 [Chitinophagaceae bacterium]|nr:hypothetical protein [Chitinophagaceae bacterium]
MHRFVIPTHDKLPVFRNAVITGGTFDGVHMGHRRVLDKLKSSRNDGWRNSAGHLPPHPRKVVSSTILGIRLINSLSEKIELLGEAWY